MSQDLSTQASDTFEKSLISDEVPLLESADTSVIKAVGITGQGLIGLDGPIPKAPYYKNVELYPVSLKPLVGEVTEVQLRPWRGPLKNRLDRQTEDVRKRLSNPAALILAIRGTNYSAENIDDLLKLYFADHPRNEELVIAKSEKPKMWLRIKRAFASFRSKFKRKAKLSSESQFQ